VKRLDLRELTSRNDPLTLFDDLLTQFPPDVQATVRKVWEALSPNAKASFLSLLVGFPADANLLNMDHRGGFDRLGSQQQHADK
jgi:hypothetical protein